MNTESLVVQVVTGITVLAFLALGIVAVFKFWRHRYARRQIVKAVEAVAAATLRDVIVPDGSGGQLHLDFLLLTVRGLLVIDLRDVGGVVFGGEHLREWTVMDGSDRSTFLNPLEPLYDRIAAVRLLAGDVPVQGRIVFTDRARFPRGRPPQVLQLGALPTEFPPMEPGAATAALERFRRAWDEITTQAEPSPLARR